MEVGVTLDPVATDPKAGMLIPQPHGGALRRGSSGTHGLSGLFKGEVPERVRLLADEVREQLAQELPGLEELSLPTVELFTQCYSRAVLLHELVLEYAEGRRGRSIGGHRRTGLEAVPDHLLRALDRAEANAAKLAQDIGLDLTGRVKALKDDAIRRSFDRQASGVAALAAAGRATRAGRES
jgi:hypothetical protein